jgi:predicted anti-sigma-YlaC factor YlaD
MNRCEHFETLVSAWLDGALARDEQVECVDHLVRCGSCRKFYVDARALDGLVAALRRPEGALAPSAETWSKIAHASRPPRRKAPVWMLQAAAVVTLALSLYLAVGSAHRFAPAQPESIDVVLGVGGNMTDMRFVELTKEMLQAEPRYRLALHDVLDQVLRDSAPREAPAGDVATPAFETTRQEPESSRRLPA